MRFAPRHIQKGKKIARKINGAHWEMGDLLSEVFPARKYKPGINIDAERRSYGDDRLKNLIGEFAAEINCDLSIGTLSMMRQTSISWPPSKRVSSCSYTAHQVLNGLENRFKLLKPGMTVAEAQLAAGHRLHKKYRGSTQYDSAIQCLQGSAGLQRSAAKKIAGLSLTNKQLDEISVLVGRNADELDGVIEAAGLILEVA